ncbi:hypothetical protein B0A55_03727 [Friedmanniomyces simplex]|uniref:Uncharacterized protein n=1 Tax=Friedmanniomyces simplex TaxID=329884 RepID=A0A4U0X359_9PEZI|nr:hypothetical protein B0A55_05471 [Friedmanniomyces simplex]TKA76347.1 hypothetical protein B0A55_03727 [Friedmanniomyces simplex]
MTNAALYSSPQQPFGFIVHNFRYRFWRVTFWMFWGAAIFTTGWVLRCVSSYYPSNLNIYIAETVFIYAGPPIFSAAEYNVLGRLMYYLPMHAPFNPGRTIIFFIYLGATVEGLTTAGASLYATAHGVNDIAVYVRGGILISVALALQAAIECMFIAMVGLMHYRCVRAKTLPRNVRTLCIMLYGTSTFVLLRCIARAIESFSTETTTTCYSICQLVLFHEWYLYVFEAAPMVLYTYWINIVHPGRLLASDKHRFLDPDGVTERIGPMWVDKRSLREKIMDPFDFGGAMTGKSKREAFWLQPQDWEVAPGGSFARGTATNIRSKSASSMTAGRGKLAGRVAVPWQKE